jgi:hypothetical protein
MGPPCEPRTMARRLRPLTGGSSRRNEAAWPGGRRLRAPPEPAETATKAEGSNHVRCRRASARLHYQGAGAAERRVYSSTGVSLRSVELRQMPGREPLVPTQRGCSMGAIVSPADPHSAVTGVLTVVGLRESGQLALLTPDLSTCPSGVLAVDPKLPFEAGGRFGRSAITSVQSGEDPTISQPCRRQHRYQHAFVHRRGFTRARCGCSNNPRPGRIIQ